MEPGRRSTRRQMLRSCAAWTAAGVALPAVVSARALASPGPNDTIGIGAIGVGRQGGSLLGGLARHQDARLVAVADVNGPRAREVAGKYNAEAYRDYRNLLERDDIDAVMTATPEQWRGLICIHACQAGKDLYVEKPMSLTVREGRLIVRAVRKHSRVFQTGSQQRSDARNRRGCEFIRSGRVGAIRRVIASNYPSPWKNGLPAQPVPDGLDWDMWCGPAPLVPYHIDLYTPRANPGWLSFRDFSGGEMTGWGSHGFDQVQWALGTDETGPVELWTEGEPLSPPTYRHPAPRDRGNRICAQPKVFFRYANGTVMELGNGPGGGAIFEGEHGTITIDRGQFTSDPPEATQDPLAEHEVHLAQSDDHIGNWLQCIRTRERCIADVEIGHRSASICHLGNIARLLGRRLHWDPVAEQFIGDDEANSHLDRPRRNGYELPTRI